MTAISKTFAPPHVRLRGHIPRSLRRDLGIGLAAVLTVLIMTVVGTRGNPGVQTNGAWPDAREPVPLAGWETSASPKLFPPAALTGEAAR
jgi:hypothetical protein